MFIIPLVCLVMVVALACAQAQPTPAGVPTRTQPATVLPTATLSATSTPPLAPATRPHIAPLRLTPPPTLPPFPMKPTPAPTPVLVMPVVAPRVPQIPTIALPPIAIATVAPPALVPPALMPPPPPPPPTQMPDPTATGDDVLSGDVLSDRWVYIVDDATSLQCGEYAGRAADLLSIRFGIQPGVTLAAGAYLPLSLVQIDAPEGAIMQYWFAPVPEPGATDLEAPDDVIIASGWDQEGSEFTLLVVLSDMRAAIEQGDLGLLIHGSIPGTRDVIILRAVLLPFC